MLREREFRLKLSKIKYKRVNEPNCEFRVIFLEEIRVILDNKNEQNYHKNYPKKEGNGE